MGDQLLDVDSNQRRDGGGLGQGRSHKCYERWSDSEYTIHFLKEKEKERYFDKLEFTQVDLA